jgi:hypothetical protein
MITINTTSPVYLHDFAMGYTGAANAGTAEIVVTAPSSSNSGSRFERLNLTPTGSACFSFLNASYWTVVNSQIACKQNAFIIANASNPDAGDSTITATSFRLGHREQQ